MEFLEQESFASDWLFSLHFSLRNIKPNCFKGKLLISGRVERLGAEDVMMAAGITTSSGLVQTIRRKSRVMWEMLEWLFDFDGSSIMDKHRPRLPLSFGGLGPGWLPGFGPPFGAGRFVQFVRSRTEEVPRSRAICSLPCSLAVIRG